jgi:hypothetical protein
MNNKHIPTEMRRSGVSTVTLNRAEVHNSFINPILGFFRHGWGSP